MPTAENRFPALQNCLYLNHAAVAPWPQITADAVQAFAAENAQQGTLNYLHWLTVEQALREQARELLNAPAAGDIALVKNTSEGLSFVAYGLDWQAGDMWWGVRLGISFQPLCLAIAGKPRRGIPPIGFARIP
jgi:Selenocysteine lyase